MINLLISYIDKPSNKKLNNIRYLSKRIKYSPNLSDMQYFLYSLINHENMDKLIKSATKPFW